MTDRTFENQRLGRSKPPATPRMACLWRSSNLTFCWASIKLRRLGDECHTTVLGSFFAFRLSYWGTMLMRFGNFHVDKRAKRNALVDDDNA